METVELAINITEVARDEGLALVARITGDRGVEYDFLRQANEFGRAFCFWEPGYSMISSIKKGRVKKLEVISNES